MKITELTYTIGSDGELRIPAATLKEMGMSAGDTASIAFLSSDGERNEYKEFVVSSKSLGGKPDDAVEQIRIPTALLQQAGISPDADLQIICGNGLVVIMRDAAMSPEELTAVCAALRAADETVGLLPAGIDIGELEDALQEAVETAEERRIGE